MDLKGKGEKEKEAAQNSAESCRLDRFYIFQLNFRIRASLKKSLKRHGSLSSF